MKLKDYKEASNIKGIWGFLAWLIKTKEFLKILIAILVVLLIIFSSQSFKCGSSKSGFWFEYDPVVKKIEIQK